MNDDELIGALHDAYAAQGEPTGDQVANLRHLVGAPGPQASRSGLRHAWAVVPAAVVVITGFGGVAYAASGGPLPVPIRRAAHAVHLPVTSQELIDVRDGQQVLRNALASQDRPRVATEVRRLRATLSLLDPAETQQVGDVQQLLDTADQQGSQSTDGASPSGGSSPTDRRSQHGPQSTEPDAGRPSNDTGGPNDNGTGDSQSDPGRGPTDPTPDTSSNPTATP